MNEDACFESEKETAAHVARENQFCNLMSSAVGEQRQPNCRRNLAQTPQQNAWQGPSESATCHDKISEDLSGRALLSP